MREVVLQHHGILGMKWGIRRTQAQLSKSNKQSSEDYKQTRILKTKSSRELSNAEIKALTTRLQLEKQYKDLSPSDTKRGLNAVKTITSAGTTVGSLYALASSPLGQAIKKTIRTSIELAKIREKEKWLL